ncbi:MAG: DUF1353 domain-containing protein [Verrucomicrobiota bacterium]
MMVRLSKILTLCVLISGCGPSLMMPSQGSARRMAVNQQAKPEIPHLKKLKNGHYRVRERWSVALNGKTWVVQKGYSSNGVTAPIRVKTALGDGVDKPETWAAVFHDWLFTQPGVSRAQADSTFHELLLAYGVSPVKAQMMYNTVKAYSLTKGLR